MKVIANIKAFFNDEEGASGIEYALIAVMVAVAITTVSAPVTTQVKAIFKSISDALTPAKT